MTKFGIVGGTMKRWLSHQDELGTVELDGGYWLRAKLMHDPDKGDPDNEQDGFWPSLDPDDAGYIGENPRTGRPYTYATLLRRTAEARRIMAAYRSDDWFWVGVIVELYGPEDNGEVDPNNILGEAALWGIECNWPHFKGGRTTYDNSYLWQVANDLIPEAIDDAADTNGRLHQVVAAVLKTRLKHSEADALSAG